MSMTFSFNGDESFTTLHICQCVGVLNPPGCPDCDEGIVYLKGDAHSCNLSNFNAREVLKLIDIDMGEDYVVSFVPTLWQAHRLAQYDGDMARSANALAFTILAAVAFKADSITGG